MVVVTERSLLSVFMKQEKLVIFRRWHDSAILYWCFKIYFMIK